MDLPNPGTEPGTPALQVDSLPAELPGKVQYQNSVHKETQMCIEQTFGLYGSRRGWDDLREQHPNMYIINGETERQSRLDA